ncbi:MAG: HD domain-containing phosphohydrolase [archaeon]
MKCCLIDPNNEITIFRIVALVGMVFYISFGLAFHFANLPDVIPLIDRIIGSLFLLIGFICTYGPNKVKDMMNIISMIIMSILNFHLIIIGYSNNFNIFHLISILTVVMIFNLLSKNIKLMSIFSIINLISIIYLLIINNTLVKSLPLIVISFLISGVSYLVSYIKIITERKLERKNSIYLSLFKDNPVAMIKTDVDGNIIDVNNQFLQMFEYENSEGIIGYNLLEIKGLKNLKILTKEYKKAFNGEIINGEVEYVSINNLKKILNYNVRPIKYNQGKNFRIYKLVIAIRDVTEERKIQNQIKYLTYHDGLTGLYNRNFYYKELNNIDTENNLPLSIVIGDLNGLKLTNDAFGHCKGDEILKQISDIIYKSCKKNWYPIRWGGDEFLILMPNTNKEEVKEYYNKLNQKMQDIKFEPINPSMSIGYKTKTNVNQRLNEIFKIAEEHMYTNKLKESKNTHSTIISSLKKTLSETTYETSQHCQRIKQLALMIGEEINLSEHELTELGLLAELHDLGKVAIPDSILCKPGKLNKEEWEKIKKHTEIGYKIASSSHELNNIAQGILSHHEWWNGCGYPQKLSKTQIPLLSRIISVVDAYDVMTNDRPYKKAFSRDTAINELIKNKGTQFDPDIVDVFLNQILYNDIN